MQTQKARNGSPDGLKKTSPRAARPLKITAALDPSESSSPVLASNRTPKDKSPRAPDRRSPRSPLSEKTRPSRISDQIQEEHKRAKDQIKSPETSKKQLLEVSAKIEETRNEFLKISASKEQAGVPDFEAETLTGEIWKLNDQIETTWMNSEIQLLRGNLMDTISLVQKFKSRIKDCGVSEAETEALAAETLRQLENAKKTVEALRSDGTKAIETSRKTTMEMEMIQALTDKLQTNLGHAEICEILVKNEERRKLGESNDLEEEVFTSRGEVDRLRTALEAMETKHREEKAELQSELKMAKFEIEKLKADVMDKETELQVKFENNQKEIDLEDELKRLCETIAKLKADLLEKEKETMESEILVRLGFAVEEADKSRKRAARVTEQLEAAQTSNTEMETELRKLKVQSNQWRKAAEAATAMLSNENYIPYCDEIDVDMVKKKNGNVLKKMGVLWKKPQK